VLWTDSVFITDSDMASLDPQVPIIAASENITLDGPNGLIYRAIEESSNELNKMIIAFGGYLNSGDLTANHLAAVLNVGIGNSVRQKALLTQVCVSGDVPGQWNWIKQWAVFWAMLSFYRMAFSRTVQDRYKARMDYYSKEVRERISKNVSSLGIPIVLQPLSQPAAAFERNTGTWGSANVAVVPGSGSAVGPFDVAITYVCMTAPNYYVSAAQPNNSESNPSTTITLEPYATGHVIQVNIGSLIPPNGAQSPASLLVAVVSLLAATHWNVYVGNSGNTLYLQNSTPIPITTLEYTLPGDPVLSGPYTLGMGQYQTRRLSIVPTRQRA